MVRNTKTMWVAYIASICVLVITMGVLGGACNRNRPSNTYEVGTFTTIGFGETASTTYESNYLKISFTAPAGYIMHSREDLDAAMNASMDMSAIMLDIDQESLDYAKLVTVYEMIVSHPNGLPNIVLLTELLESEEITLDMYIDTLTSQLAQTGMNYSIDSVAENTTIAGQAYRKISTTVNVQGYSMIQDYMLRRYDGRIIGFVVTYSDETINDMHELMALFIEK